MENKAELRIKIKAIRKTLNIEKKSRIISEKIKNSEIYRDSKNIMLFYPTEFEVNLLDLVNKEKNFYFPKVNGDDLWVCPICKNFKKSQYNIWEPCSDPVSCENLDLVIVPALAVDKKHYRLGYGGGYYDRFLSKYPNLLTLTPIFKEFIFDELPVYNSDIKIKYIISD